MVARISIMVWIGLHRFGEAASAKRALEIRSATRWHLTYTLRTPLTSYDSLIVMNYHKPQAITHSR